MKKIVIIVLGLLALGAVFVFAASDNVEAPGDGLPETTEQSPAVGTALNDEEAGIDAVINFTDDGFDPVSTGPLALGDTVRFVNLSSSTFWPASNAHPTHTDYSEFDALGPIPQGESYDFTFTQAGTWGFHDHLSPNFGGTIEVLAGL